MINFDESVRQCRFQKYAISETRILTWIFTIFQRTFINTTHAKRVRVDQIPIVMHKRDTQLNFIKEHRNQ